MQIGRFMRLTQLSRKALRLYEQQHILVPAAIDAQSGYRFYADEQIEVARLIRLLRGMEMPLALVRPGARSSLTAIGVSDPWPCPV